MQLRSDSLRRQSFDRFGDDLCELVLSYLSIDDRLRLECVCRQWQSLVFSRDVDLRFDDQISGFWFTINDKVFESVLKKCGERLQRIVIYGNYSSKRLDLMTRYCRRLSQIEWNFRQLENVLTDGTDRKSVKDFCDKFADSVRSLHVIHVTPGTLGASILGHMIVRSLVSHLRELVCVGPLLISWKLFGLQVRRPAIRRLTFEYRTGDGQAFESVVRQNGTQLKALTVKFNDRPEVEDKALVELLSRLKQMSNLIELRISFSSFIGHQLSGITDALAEVGLNCRHLQRLSLDLNVEKRKELLYLLQVINTSFNHIHRLELVFMSTRKWSISSRHLSDCKQLTHLKINSMADDFHTIYDSFFQSIDTHLPGLQWLSISGAKMTDRALESLARLSRLQTIELSFCETNFSNKSIENMYTKCQKLERIVIKTVA